MLTAAAAVFAVSDMQASLAWYRDRLGFNVHFTWEEPVSYACLCQDSVDLHLATTRSPDSLTIGRGNLCVFVRDVDALYARLVTAGVMIPQPPQDWPYGMREFVVTDPDGNRLIFGQHVMPAQASVLTPGQ